MMTRMQMDPSDEDLAFTSTHTRFIVVLKLIDFLSVVESKSCGDSSSHAVPVPTHGNNLSCPPLHDDDCPLRLMNLLKQKFTRQQLGKTLYLKNRELQYHDFFPIEFMNDEEFVLNHVRKYGYGLHLASQQLQQNPNFLMKLVERGLELNFIVSKAQPQDREIVWKAVQHSGYALSFASEEFKNDPQIVLEAIRTNYGAFISAPDEFKQDRDFAMNAVQCNCKVFTLFKKLDWVRDWEIAVEAIRQEDSLFKYASNELKNDKKFIMELLRHNRKVLHHVEAPLQDDMDIIHIALTHVSDSTKPIQWTHRETVLQIVKEFGYLLKHASQELRNDNEIVLTAVTQNAMALEFASDLLKHDRLIALTACLQQPYVFLTQVPHIFKSDKDFVIQVVKRAGSMLEHASEELQKDKEVVLAAVQAYGCALQFALNDLNNDKQVVLTAVKQDGFALEFASHQMALDKEVTLAAAEQCIGSLEYASYELCNDKEFMLQLIHIDCEALEYASQELKKDKEFLLAAITLNEEVLEYVPKQLRYSKEFMLSAIKKNGKAFNYAGLSLHGDQELMLSAIQHDPCVLRYGRNIAREVILEAVKKDGLALMFSGIRNDEEIVLEAIKCNGFANEYTKELMNFRLEHYYSGAYLGKNWDNIH